MKLVLILSLCLISVAGLSACRTTADVKNDRYSVDLDGDDRYYGEGRFCPPGQAKKGRC